MAGTAFPTREGMSPAPRRTVGAGCGDPSVTGSPPLVNAATGGPSSRWMSVSSQGREAVHSLRWLVPRLDEVDGTGDARAVQSGHDAVDGVHRSFEHHLDAAV